METLLSSVLVTLSEWRPSDHSLQGVLTAGHSSPGEETGRGILRCRRSITHARYCQLELYPGEKEGPGRTVYTR